METIRIGHPADYVNVSLLIDKEGAQYISEVMEDEWIRSHDSGAKAIADAIRNRLGVREW